MCAESRNSGWYGSRPLSGYQSNAITLVPEAEVEKLRTQLQNAEAEIRELKEAVKSLQAASMYGRKLKGNR